MVMGLTGSFSKESSKTKKEEQQKTDTQRTTTGQATGTVDSQASERSVTTLLSDDIQGAIADVVLSLTGNAIGETAIQTQITDIANTLLQRAGTAEGDINEKNDAIVGEARRGGEKDLTRLQTDLAQQAGGTGANSFVVGATAEGRAALESQLASLSAQLGLNARNTQTEEFNNVIGALVNAAGTDANAANAIAQLSSVLRGSTQVTESTREATANELKTFNEQLSEIVNTLITGTSETKSKSMSVGGSIGPGG